MERNEQTIKLFKAVVLNTKAVGDNEKLLFSKREIVRKTLEKGFLFSKELLMACSYDQLIELIPFVEKHTSINATALNNTFQTSWKKVSEAPIQVLLIEQLMHYFTTYGYKQLGIFDDETVYVPYKDLEIPELKESNLNIPVIKGISVEELKIKIMNILNSGIALKAETSDILFELVNEVGITAEEIETIKNKETKIKLYTSTGKVPKNPVEFLRTVLYITTGESLLIKNHKTIEVIKSGCEKSGKMNTFFFNVYIKKYGIQVLASIFYRFKPLFLAMKKEKTMKPIINKIRRMAERYHKPMPEDFLNTITKKLVKGSFTDIELKDALKKANIFRKIRLAYSLNYRLSGADTIMYNIRNGKSYVKSFNYEGKDDTTKFVYNIILQEIAKEIQEIVGDKKIFYPDFVNYALPSTEKQFTGNFPSGSYIDVPEDMIVGIHWENQPRKSIDLDLSMNNANVGKIGWDSSYRTRDKKILFSGDLTNAPLPNGATELFYVKSQDSNSYLLNVNYFNYSEDVPVPFKIVVAKDNPDNFERNYMLDPNKILAFATSVMDVHQKTIGMLIPREKGSRFYFVEANMGGGITTRISSVSEGARKYLVNFYKNSINLREVLEYAEVTFVDKEEDADINLSPATLEKDTILNLLIKSENNEVKK